MMVMGENDRVYRVRDYLREKDRLTPKLVLRAFGWEITQCIEKKRINPNNPHIQRGEPRRLSSLCFLYRSKNNGNDIQVVFVKI